MDHCAKHPLKLLLPDPARGPRRSGHAAIVPYYGCRIFHFETRLHGCRGRTLDRGGPGAALPGLQTVCLSVRSNQKLDVGSPRQLANRAGCNVRRRSTKPLDPNQCIDGTEPLAGPKPRLKGRVLDGTCAAAIFERSFRAQGWSAHRGQPAVRRLLPLSLTFDHRVVTGGEAARFLVALKSNL